MAISRRDDTLLLATGEAVSGAEVYYLTQPADLTTLTPLAPVYANTTGTPAANPQITDGFGQVAAYLSDSQLYTVVFYTPYLGKTVYPDQCAGCGSGSGGSGGAGFTPVAVSSTAGTIAGAIPGNTFTLPSTPYAGSLVLQANGSVLTDGLGYTRNDRIVTLTTALDAGDTIAANYLTVGGGGNYTAVFASSTDGSIAVTIPGSTFTLPSAPHYGSLILQVNSTVLTDGLGYTLNDRNGTLATPLEAGDTIAANYLI